MTSTLGNTQVTGKATHVTNNSSFCTDLIFASNPSIIVDSGIEKSVCCSCRHDVIYGKINFRVTLPLTQFSTLWDYMNPDDSSIQRAKTISEKVQVLNKVLMNILGSFDPRRLLEFNYK